LARDPEAVVRDVRWNKVSAEAALHDYGVVLTGSLDDDTLSYNPLATETERVSRTGEDTAFFDRGPSYGTLAAGAEYAAVDLV